MTYQELFIEVTSVLGLPDDPRTVELASKSASNLALSHGRPDLCMDQQVPPEMLEGLRAALKAKLPAITKQAMEDLKLWEQTGMFKNEQEHQNKFN